MEVNLTEQFELAVGGDPGVVPGELARAAIAEGTRLRRRRNRLAAAGVAAGLVLVIGAPVALRSHRAEPPVTVAAAMMPVAAPSCTRPVERDATDVVVFLRASATESQRSALQAALDRDPRVGTLIFESRAQAYERFRARWAREPDLVAAVTTAQFPEAYRLRLVRASQYAAVRSRYAVMGGVEQIIGRVCPTDAPVGGIQ